MHLLILFLQISSQIVILVQEFTHFFLFGVFSVAIHLRKNVSPPNPAVKSLKPFNPIQMNTFTGNKKIIQIENKIREKNNLTENE